MDNLFFCLVFVMPLCASVYLCLVVTCWERTDLLALVCGGQSDYRRIPQDIAGSLDMGVFNGVYHIITWIGIL